MKIILVGANGTIGKRIYEEFAPRHEVISVGRTSGDIRADIASLDSIREMYKQVGDFDAVVNAAGAGYFGPWDEMDDEKFRIGIDSKLMGQINLVLEGRNLINEGGSFTLTTGILSDDPVAGSANLAAVNGAINAFVKPASLELKRGVRINVISPGMVEDAVEAYGPYFPGHIAVSMKRTVAGYVKSVEGFINGEVVRIF